MFNCLHHLLRDIIVKGLEAFETCIVPSSSIMYGGNA